MSDTDQTTPSPVVEAPAVKKKNGNVGRPVSEKQREALKKGMEALKLKREQMAKEKDERKKTNEELKAKGLPPVEPPIKLKKQEVVEVKPAVVEPVKIKERKVRSDKGVPKKDIDAKAISRGEFNELREMLKGVAAMKQTEKVVEKPVEKIVEKVVEKPVEKTKVLTGSELLNAIFFK
jgi:hypothetical protein